MENDHEMKRVIPPNLPYEIVFDILSRLPVKSLCRFKSVSKPWLALITDPQFIQSHLHQSMKSDVNQKVIIVPRYSNSSESFYSLDYQAPVPTVAELDMPYKSERYPVVEIWGSFNGVLLFEIGDELCLWNPSISKYQKFSQPSYPGYSDVWFGLGYDSISDDFKVVAAVFPPDRTSDPISVVHVFSSKLSSWKIIGDFDCRSYLAGAGTVLNGAPHWLFRRCTVIYFHIVCFDVMEEKFKEVPNPIDEVEYDSCTLGVLGGWLCVVNSHLVSHSDVWVMKEYGIKESWTKLFVVPNVPGEFFFNYFELLCFTKDGEVVVNLKSHDSAKLVIYNADNKTYRRIGIPQDCKDCDVALYVESLVSPHARVLEGANEMEMEAKVSSSNSNLGE